MATKPGLVYGKINGSWYSDVRNESVFKAIPHASLTYCTFKMIQIVFKTFKLWINFLIWLFFDE